MRYSLPCSSVCILLSLCSGVGSVRWSSHGSGSSKDGFAQHHTSSSSTSSSTNDYMESTLRRLALAKKVMAAGPKSCRIDGRKDCASTYYYYKDFEDTGGVTFARAHAATGTEADLQGCVLAPMYSYQDLLEISAAIPPCKAAYTAAYKDPLQAFREARACASDEGKIPYNCDFQALGTTLETLWGDADHGAFGACTLEDWFGDDFIGGDSWCPALKEGWTNFGSSEAIPSTAWRKGDSSYCGEGPIPNAAAAFATEYPSSHFGEPTAFLKAVNSGESLPGAVYKCCQDTISCLHQE